MCNKKDLAHWEDVDKIMYVWTTKGEATQIKIKIPKVVRNKAQSSLAMFHAQMQQSFPIGRLNAHLSFNVLMVISLSMQ